jgi:hypothetical protein
MATDDKQPTGRRGFFAAIAARATGSVAKAVATPGLRDEVQPEPAEAKADDGAPPVGAKPSTPTTARRKHVVPTSVPPVRS